MNQIALTASLSLKGTNVFFRYNDNIKEELCIIYQIIEML